MMSSRPSLRRAVQGRARLRAYPSPSRSASRTLTDIRTEEEGRAERLFSRDLSFRGIGEKGRKEEEAEATTAVVKLSLSVLAGDSFKNYERRPSSASHLVCSVATSSSSSSSFLSREKAENERTKRKLCHRETWEEVAGRSVLNETQNFIRAQLSSLHSANPGSEDSTRLDSTRGLIAAFPFPTPPSVDENENWTAIWDYVFPGKNK